MYPSGEVRACFDELHERRRADGKLLDRMVRAEEHWAFPSWQVRLQPLALGLVQLALHRAAAVAVVVAVVVVHVEPVEAL